MLRIGPKYPWERVPVRIDFKKLLAAGETLSSIDSVSVSVASGPLDNNPDALIDGGAVVDADTVAALWARDGIAEADYEIAVKALTTGGAKREGKVRLFVSEKI